MRENLENNIAYLDESCIKQKRINQNIDIVKSDIQVLLEGIYLKKKIKKEANFSYIYCEVGNLDKIFDGKLIILEDRLPQIYQYKHHYLVYCKELLLLYNNEVFTLKITQNLYNIGIYCNYDEVDNDIFLFGLPTFVAKEVIIDIVEAGVTRTIINKKINYSINTKIIKEALNDIKINITDDAVDYNVKVYYDDILEFEDDSIFQMDTLRSYLKEKYYDGSISYEDLSFDKTIEEIQNDFNENSRIEFSYVTPSFVEKSRGFSINDNSKLVNFVLKNNSKIKIEISQYVSCLNGKEIYLKDFLYNIVLPKHNLYIDRGNYFKDLIILENEKILEYESSKEAVNTDIKYDIYDNLLIPKNFFAGLITDDKFEEKLIHERLSLSLNQKYAYLRQYYYVKSKDDTSNDKEYIFKVIFRLKKVVFKFAKKTFVGIIPCLEENFYKIEIYSKSQVASIEEKLNKNQKEIKNYINKISCLEDLGKIQDYIVSCMIKLYPEIENCRELSENRDIYDDFYESNKINFFNNSNVDVSNLSCEDYIDDKCINYLLKHFENNITFLA